MELKIEHKTIFYKTLIILLVISTCSTSYAYTKSDSTQCVVLPVVTPEFETFDSITYLKYKIPNRDYAINNTSDGTEIQLDETNGEPYGYFETPTNSYFYICKIYYPNGNIKNKGLRFISGDFEKGVWYYYDQQGNLTDTIDYDEPFKFTFDDVLDFCKKHGINILRAPIDQTKYGRSKLEKRPPSIVRLYDSENKKGTWTITYDNFVNNSLTIILDATTGEEIERISSQYRWN